MKKEQSPYMKEPNNKNYTRLTKNIIKQKYKENFRGRMIIVDQYYLKRIESHV